jgi:hypothetical protein
MKTLEELLKPLTANQISDLAPDWMKTWADVSMWSFGWEQFRKELETVLTTQKSFAWAYRYCMKDGTFNTDWGLTLNADDANSLINYDSSEDKSYIEIIKLYSEPIPTELSAMMNHIKELESAVLKLTMDVEFEQCRVDALMLEYCPDDMTEEQKENWTKHQRPYQES